MPVLIHVPAQSLLDGLGGLEHALPTAQVVHDQDGEVAAQAVCLPPALLPGSLLV